MLVMECPVAGSEVAQDKRSAALEKSGAAIF